MSGTLICYGDSNTYGYDPHDTNEGRYPKEVRWTGILDTETDWKVENHGVNGRSIPHTVSTVKFACQQVRDWHRKPNSVWLLVMLGTNDLLENPDFTAADVAKRMERFLKRKLFPRKILLGTPVLKNRKEQKLPAPRWSRRSAEPGRDWWCWTPSRRTSEMMWTCTGPTRCVPF